MYGDSALIIYQLNGEWEIKDSKLVMYHKIIMKMMEQLEEISFGYFPREENYLANALATLSAMFKVNNNIESNLLS